jgi:hypothetical protein
MSLPEYQRIANHMITVVEAQGLENHGKCEYGDATVYVRDEDAPSIKVSTLVHELAHVMYQARGLSEKDGGMDMEEVVNFCEGFVVDLYANNNPDWMEGLGE